MVKLLHEHHTQGIREELADVVEGEVVLLLRQPHVSRARFPIFGVFAKQARVESDAWVSTKIKQPKNPSQHLVFYGQPFYLINKVIDDGKIRMSDGAVFMPYVTNMNPRREEVYFPYQHGVSMRSISEVVAGLGEIRSFVSDQAWHNYDAHLKFIERLRL